LTTEWFIAREDAAIAWNERPPHPDTAWREAIEEECTVAEIGWVDDPVVSLRNLIDWHVKVSLDPAVSSDAQALMQRGRADAEAELKRLLEIERMRVVACMTVASANTRESAARAREMHDDYKCAAVNDVAAVVDREMALRDELERLRAAVRRMFSADILGIWEHDGKHYVSTPDDGDSMELTTAELDALRRAVEVGR